MDGLRGSASFSLLLLLDLWMIACSKVLLAGDSRSDLQESHQRRPHNWVIEPKEDWSWERVCSLSKRDTIKEEKKGLGDTENLQTVTED